MVSGHGDSTIDDATYTHLLRSRARLRSDAKRLWRRASRDLERDLERLYDLKRDLDRDRDLE